MQQYRFINCNKCTILMLRNKQGQNARMIHANDERRRIWELSILLCNFSVILKLLQNFKKYFKRSGHES